MARKFNLQPWREERRKAQKKQFVTITFVVVAIAVGLAFADRWMQKKTVEQQEEGIRLLESDIAKFKSAQTKVEAFTALNNEVNKQINIIQGLQSQRGLAVEILDYIATKTPDDVFLNYIDFNGSSVVINGVTKNDKGVSEFMRIMSNFEHFSTTILSNIQTARGNNLYSVSGDSEVKNFEVAIQIPSQKVEEVQP